MVAGLMFVSQATVTFWLPQMNRGSKHVCFCERSCQHLALLRTRPDLFAEAIGRVEVALGGSEEDSGKDAINDGGHRVTGASDRDLDREQVFIQRGNITMIGERTPLWSLGG